MTFCPLDVRLPVIPVTVVVSPELSWEAVVCCVDGETTKLLVGVAVSVGSMEEVVIEDDIDVVASICRCSSGSCVSSTPPRAERRRDRPPSRRFRNSDNRRETGPRRELPHRRPPPNRSNRAACPPLHENRRAPQGTTRSSVEDPTAEFPDHRRKVKLFCKNRCLWREKWGVRVTVGPRSIATARPVGTFPNAKGVDQLFVSFSAE